MLGRGSKVAKTASKAFKSVSNARVLENPSAKSLKNVAHTEITTGKSGNSQVGKRRKNWLPEKGAPDSIKKNFSENTIRKYGPDGYPQKDFNKGHSGKKVPKNERKDHIHDYKPNPFHPNQEPIRQPGRPVRNKDKVDLEIIKRNKNANN